MKKRFLRSDVKKPLSGRMILFCVAIALVVCIIGGYLLLTTGVVISPGTSTPTATPRISVPGIECPVGANPIQICNFNSPDFPDVASLNMEVSCNGRSASVVIYIAGAYINAMGNQDVKVVVSGTKSDGKSFQQANTLLHDDSANTTWSDSWRDSSWVIYDLMPGSTLKFTLSAKGFQAQHTANINCMAHYPPMHG